MMKRIKISAWLFLVTLTALTTFPYQGRAQAVKFNAPFAPSAGYTNDTEKPYRQSISLNGLWHFEPCALPFGFKEGIDVTPELPAFSANDVDKIPIRIPSPWNANDFADHDGLGGDFNNFPSYPKSWEKIKMGWLYRKFTVPAEWKGKTVILHFDAVAGDAQVFVNGTKAGSHFDIFLPFDIDVTRLVKYGKENEITVGVRKASLFDKQGKYGRRTYQGGSFWGQHIAGIWQDVTLIAKPMLNISDIYVRPQLDSDLLVEQVTLTNNDPDTKRIGLQGKVYGWVNHAGSDVLSAPVPVSSLGKAPVLQLSQQQIVIPAGGTVTVTLQQKITGQLKTWSPDAPNLYGMVISINDHDVVMDNKYVRFGWRQTKIVGKDFLLNGSPIIVRGDSWHFMGIPQMTRRYAWAWFKALKDAHLNAVRLHAEPYPSFYLDMADEMGVMVLDESAMWASDGGPKFDDPAYWKDSERHLADLIRRDRDHPSVFGWSISNEIVPVIRNVMHNPPGLLDILISHYAIWADSCRRLDPSRPWISADGEDDGSGRLPTYIVHYGGFQAMDRGLKSPKPWGVGEAGNAYYGTPEQVAGTNGDRAYTSFEGRMEGVAASSYQSLVAQRQRKAVYRSVFNLVWYGLQPLALGLKDTSRAPQVNDGIFFSSFVEDVAGVQPERLGPYCTTLNPGYDPNYPLYKPWPLFEAIKDASGDTTIVSRWANIHPAARKTTPTVIVQPFKIIGGPGSELISNLKKLGILVDRSVNTGEKVLLIDGLHPPGENIKKEINEVTASGGRVIIFGADNGRLSKLNKLLPSPLEITDRKASSLVIEKDNPIVAGIGLADLYFSEQSPADVISTGLAGPFTNESNTVLADCNTDWLRWNKQPEYAKTISILRSEREKKPAGAVMISKQIGQGELLVTTFPLDSRLLKVELAARKILSNLGLPLDANVNSGAAITGNNLVHVLSSDGFTLPSLQEALSKIHVDPAKGALIKDGVQTDGHNWSSSYQDNGVFTLSGKNKKTVNSNEIVYLSFWVSSPRSLEDLLLEPNLPTVNFTAMTTGAVQIWLNGAPVLENTADGQQLKASVQSEPLKLKQGWNHFLIKLIRTGDQWTFSGHFTSNQPEFLKQLESAIEKP